MRLTPDADDGRAAVAQPGADPHGSVTAPPPAAPRAPAPVPQPYLHELVTCLRAPAVVLGGPDGQIRSGGVQGVFRHDRRVLSELLVDVDGQEPTAIGRHQRTAGTARFVAVVRHLGDPLADPTVRLERERHATADGVREHLTLVNASRRPVLAAVRVRAAADFAAIDGVKHGGTPPPEPPVRTGPATASWSGTRARATLRVTGPAELAVAGDRLSATWRVTVAPRGTWTTTVTLTAAGVDTEPRHTFEPAAPAGWRPVVTAGPPELARLVERGVSDLEGLLLADPLAPRDRFVAAGSPWFLTLFGRDALWTARLTLALGTELARGTLHALARRQGTRSDPETAEAPGKIPHEVRCQPHQIVGEGLVYFGTVDATALWVCLLHDAWRWGMPAGEVAELLDPLQAALGWLLEHADPDRDGLLEYLDATGRGLANQGWKDSGDAIQFADGTLARPPIALSEAQAYAYEAGLAGATLLEAFSRPGAGRVRAWARRLRHRFRASYWVEDARGRFPAVALDGGGRPVDVASSNLGHLLGTGLLAPDEVAAVAARLGEGDLDCGYGLRTLSSDAAGFNPLGYHTGTVWPHDTAIAVRGLVREGHPDLALSLATGLLRVAPTFRYRMPELFAGTDARAGEPVLAYPAACRPQAWSAAAAVALVQAGLGLAPDVPNGVMRVRPRFRSWLPLEVTGLRVAGHPLAVTVDAGGSVQVDTSAPLKVHIRPAGPRPRVPRARPVPAPRHQT
jgi:glycogen debranching enzyme